MIRKVYSAAFILFFHAYAFSASDPNDEVIPDLTKIGVEQLVNIEVTSVSKREQKVSEAAVAVFVITQRDIRRSGATSIPELLRMVPGLNVARIDANKWAISSRGFNSRFSNKLLVLMDGRTLYTPLFSGVFWDVQDTFLQDIERIEVIRGPGATLWGANAVNGVINIITKHAKETVGTVVDAGGGSEERGFVNARYGGTLRSKTHYRIFAKYFDRDDSLFASGTTGADGWRAVHTGFRLDSEAAAQDSYNVQADFYNANIGDIEIIPTLSPPFSRTLTGEADASGADVLGRWKHSFSNTSSMTLQLYYDRTSRNDTVHREVRNSFDIDFQHSIALAARHEVVWGLQYRVTHDDLRGTVRFIPSERTDQLFSGFLQDEIQFLSGQFHLVVGSKFENNDYTGFEIQPNVRFLWRPERKNTFWAAVSRAVRTPARFEDDAEISVSAAPTDEGPLALTVLFGNRNFGAEKLIAYEVGYRVQPTFRFYLDLAAFYNDYSDLRTFEPGDPFVELNPAPIHLVIPIRPENRMDGHTYGIEALASWNATEQWKCTIAYSRLNVQLKLRPDSVDVASVGAEGDTPKNLFQFRSFLDLPFRLKFDATIYRVGRLTNQDVPGYTRFDAQISWNPNDTLETKLVLQNLFNDRHPEFGTSFLITPTEIQRNIYASITARF